MQYIVMEMKSNKLIGKKIALLITGSIAAVECVKLSRELQRHGADITCYMSKGASEIIHPNTMEFATGKKPITSLTGALEHLVNFDLILVAPATANTLSKIAHGIADNPVTALIAGATCQVILAPTMHQEMYENPIFQKNLVKLKEEYTVIEPKMEENAAKMAEIKVIIDEVLSAVSNKDMIGKKVLITAGPTAEPIDAIRIITNRSSGKMGIALAREAKYRGAVVTLVLGPGPNKPPESVEVIRVESAEDMATAIKMQKSYDIYIGAAAVSDFTTTVHHKKISSRAGSVKIELKPTDKIISTIDKNTLKVGFKAEHNISEDALIKSAKNLAKEHNLDLVVANDVSKDIFGSDESEALILMGKNVIKLKRMQKSELAGKILDALVSL